MLQLWRTPLHCRSAVSGKRTRTLQASGRRMLRLTQWWHDRRPSFWHNNHSCRPWPVSATKRVHCQLLVCLLALHNNHLRHPRPARRDLRTTKIRRNPSLLKTRPTRLADSSVVPFGKQNSKPEYKCDQADRVEINQHILAHPVCLNQSHKRPNNKNHVHNHLGVACKLDLSQPQKHPNLSQRKQPNAAPSYV